MSKSRFNWWPTATNITRDYPQRKRDLEELKRVKITADPSSVSGCGGSSRTVERVALRQLPYQEQKEYDAVHSAIEITKGLKDGDLRYQVVKDSFWKGLRIKDIAKILPVSERVARRWRWEFLLTVGWQYGSINEAEYQKNLKKFH